MERNAGRPRAVLAVVLALVFVGFLPSALPAAGSDPSPAPAASPQILWTSPGDGAVGVGQRSFIIVTFSNPMNTSSVTVTIAPFVDLFRSWQLADTRLVMANYSSPFLDCTVYTIQIAGTDTNGSALVPGPVPNPWSFTTAGCGNPYIVSTLPADGEMLVPVWVSIYIDFSEVMNEPSVTWAFSDPRIAFSSSWLNETLLLQVTTPLAACSLYTMGITGGVDLSGLPLVPGPAPNPWSFTTDCGYPRITWTDPSDGERYVPVDYAITVEFSEAMDAPTVTWTLSPAISLVGNWTANDTLVLTHATPFADCTAYTIAIQGQDLGGNPLVPGTVPNPWTFTTSCGEPYIVATSPADGATGVALDAPIVVSFSEPMNTTSVTWAFVPTFPFNESWGTADSIMTLSHAAPFSACTVYTVQILSGTDTAGYSLVPLPHAWSFETACSTAVADLLSPIGGESWTGASTHPIRWNQSSPLGADMNWTLEWSTDGGTTWSRLANGTAGTGPQTYDWAVPLVDRTTNRIRVCVEAGPPPPMCDASRDFTIDSTAPYVAYHDPPDGALDVLFTMFLTVQFSEPMDPASTEAAFWITPPALVMGKVWPAPTTLVLQIEGLLSATRYTWGFQCSATDRSSPGNPLSNCTETHSFTTEGGRPPPSVSLTSPLGGESWTGGTAHPVRFMVDNTGLTTEPFTVTASYGYAGGTRGGIIGTQTLTVPAGTALDGEIPWTTPTIDAPDVIVNVTVTNRTGTSFWDESGPFEIDSTPPIVVFASPAGPGIPLDPTVSVTFSEPMAVMLFDDPIFVFPVVPWTHTWRPARDGLDAALLGTRPCTTYTVSIGASLIPEAAPLRDRSDPGNPFFPRSWTFATTCEPSVDLLAPDGGEDWTGGSVHDIRWITTDSDDATLTVTLSYSLDGGADGFPYVISSGLVVPTGAGSLPWTLPMLDAGEVLVRIDVADAAGNTATDASAAVFTIDSTPPALFVSFPADGSTGHKTTRAIWFVWTERVDPASFVAAFSLAPDPGGLTFDWSVSNLGGDVLLVDHKPFASRTSYAATFAVSAKDDSDPGNFLAAPLVVRFSTQPPPNVNPPVAKAVGHHQVEAGVPATFDGSASTGDIRDYTWRITDNQKRFVAVLVGVRATYTFTEHGRYSVTLFVTDASGLSDDDTIEIAVTSSSNSADIVFVVAAGAALLVAALIGATEAGRLAAFSLVLFPLYARKRKDEPAEQETRGMIRGYVLVHPGDSYTDIKRNLGLGNGTLTYHLTILEREGIVRSQVRGSRKLFFPREARLPEDGGGLHEVQLRMLRAVQAIPGLAVTDLAGALGITSQLALYHLRDLAAKGRIRFERRGLRLRCYADDSNPAPMD